MRRCGDQKADFNRFCANGLPCKKTIIAVARKPIVLANAILKRQTPWVESAALDGCYPSFRININKAANPNHDPFDSRNNTAPPSAVMADSALTMLIRSPSARTPISMAKMMLVSRNAVTSAMEDWVKA